MHQSRVGDLGIGKEEPLKIRDLLQTSLSRIADLGAPLADIFQFRESLRMLESRTFHLGKG
jgi:hypothetical protein